MDQLTAPLAIVQQLVSESTSHVDLHKAAGEHFAKLWDQLGDQITDLNTTPTTQIRSGELVRFRCMVQAIRSPEYFCPFIRETDTQSGNVTRRTTSFQDFIPRSDNTFTETEDSLAEREVLVCIPPPGETHWMTHLTAPSPPAKQPQNRSTTTAATTTSPTTALRGGEKRSRATGDAADFDGDEEVNAAEDMDAEPTRFVRPRTQPRASQTASSTSNNQDGGQQFHANEAAKCFYPISNSLSVGASVVRAVIAKVYDDSEECKAKVGELVEMLGVFESNPNYAHDCDDTDLDVSVPASVVPRLHCIVLRKNTTGFPSIPAVLSSDELVTARNSLINRLKQALCGDSLAAEYTLLAMLSQVTTRTQGMVVGSLGVNLITEQTNTQNHCSIGKNLEAVIADVMPRVVYCPITVNTLNAGRFVPQMDHTTQLLHTGALQVCSGTLILFDQTTMTEGTLTQAGVKSLGAVQRVLSEQSLTYDFQFYELSFNTDIKPIVISSGKSMLETPIKLRIVSTSQPAENNNNNNTDLKGDLTPLCRFLIAQAHSVKFDVPSEVCKVVEDDYVKARQQQQNISQHTLHMWLGLARMLALSYGETQLTVARWQQALELESARLHRMDSVLA